MNRTLLVMVFAGFALIAISEAVEAASGYALCCAVLSRVPETIPDEHHAGEINTQAGDLCAPLAPQPVR
ncbi:MAG: hypothetical protein ACT4PT_04210 [Methanobacteriota archaeon]